MADPIHEADFYKGLFVAVHAGAGSHSEEKSKQYRELCRKACMQAMQLLKEKRSASDAVTAAVCVLEDSELSNAGRGSNLTLQGTVECDAGVMEGSNALFGAVGCLCGSLNPVRVACSLLRCQQQGPLSLGRVPPSVLVGTGAADWARQQGFPCQDHHKLITDNSTRLYRKYKSRVERAEKLGATGKLSTDVSFSSSIPSQFSTSNLNESFGEASLPGFLKRTIPSSSDNHASLNGTRPCKLSKTALSQNSVTHNYDADSNSDCSIADKEKDGDLRVNRVALQQTDAAGMQGCKFSSTTLTQNSETLDNGDEGWVNHSIASEGEDHYVEENSNRCEGKEEEEEETQRGAGVQDTVGAVCVDWQGHLSAAVSSGGIWLKQPGRLGPAAMFGAGCWAQNGDENLPGVAVITSGCGEHLMRTSLAKTCAECLLSAQDTTEGLRSCFTRHFLDSRLLSGVGSRLAGVVALRLTGTQHDAVPDVEVCWGHTTESMALGYLSGDGHRPKTLISRLSEGCQPGQSFTMSSAFFQHC